MSLIKCTECGHMISDRAIKCPNCGAPRMCRNNAAPQCNRIQPQQQQQYNQVPLQTNPTGIQNQSYSEEVTNGDSEPSVSLNIIAYLLYIASLADFCLGNFAHIDLTGVWWSPILLGGVGALFQKLAYKK